MIILASGSWLRKTIMQASEFVFEVETKDVDERRIEALYHENSHAEVVEMLARAKADVVGGDHPDDLVIGADTFVVLPDGERGHKPKTKAEAFEICLAQSGKKVTVYTGVAVSYQGKVAASTTSSTITYSKFDKRQLELLFQNDDPTIRNAGLGFFMDAPGFTLVEAFEGSYTGAMGLPMDVVRQLMREVGFSA